MRKIAVLQSNYIPWRGYFDIIHDVDEFIFYDEVKYTKNSWRNRNQIYTENGLKWLTLPCGKEYSIPISEVTVKNELLWQKDHWSKIAFSYKKAPHFTRYKDFFEDFYLSKTWSHLSEINQYLISHISQDFLGIDTQFSSSESYVSSGQKGEKLISLLQSAKADYYLSGPAAKDYIEPEDYEKAGIELAWKDYSGYPPYPQLYEPFEPAVSILDLLFNTGPDAPYYIWGWRTDKS